MFWDNAVTDLDLHVLRDAGAALGSIPDDCHYANPHPDWGTVGVAQDDPELLRDALTGYGPEVFGYGARRQGATGWRWSSPGVTEPWILGARRPCACTTGAC